MTTVRAVMDPLPASAQAGDTVGTAAVLMRDTGVGAVPVCDEFGCLLAVLTEHDIVVRCVAAGLDPGVTAVAGVTAGPAVSVGVEQGLEQALARMIEHAVRRLPVTEAGRLVGQVAQSTLTDALGPAAVRRLLAGTGAA